MHDQFVKLLATLVSFRSVDGQSQEKQKIAAFVAQWLEQKDINVQLYPHATAPSVVATLPGEGDPILLLTHLDVVPAPEAMFQMTLEGDRCFGRGVVDDKGSVAIVMFLLEALAAVHKRPAIKAVFTNDEEIGSHDGVLRLLSMGVLGPVRAVIALDGGSEDTVIVREKGVCHFQLRAQGTSVHNSRPWEGDNAVEKIIRVYDRIKQSFPPGNADDPLHWHETVSIGSIEGGQFVNQVPENAVAQIDMRFTEKYSVKEIRRILDAQLEPGVTIEIIGTGECFQTDSNHPLLQTYMCAMQKQGRTITTSSEHGATDARFFAHLTIPIWMHDPTGGGLHTDGEWLDVPSAVRVLQGLEEFCKRIID